MCVRRQECEREIASIDDVDKSDVVETRRQEMTGHGASAHLRGFSLAGTCTRARARSHAESALSVCVRADDDRYARLVVQVETREIRR